MNVFANDKPFVIYLEENDFDTVGKPTFNTEGKPIMIMIQGNFCGYCKKAKPDFLETAKVENARSNQKVFFATVLIDGTEKEKNILKKFKMENYRGVPHYIVVFPNGHLIEYDGNRDAKSLLKFIDRL